MLTSTVLLVVLVLLVACVSLRNGYTNNGVATDELPNPSPINHEKSGLRSGPFRPGFATFSWIGLDSRPDGSGDTSTILATDKLT